MTLQAYKSGIEKDIFIAEIKNHMEADDFIKGVYDGEESKEGNRLEGKGCAVGCSIKSINRIKNSRHAVNDHEFYAQQLGIPRWLAHMEDKIFEGLSIQDAKEWPLRFSLAINIGADLSSILHKLLTFVIKSTLKYFDNDKYENIVRIINDLSFEFAKKETDKEKIKEIRVAAADAADAAAYAATDVAAYTYAAYAAGYAAADADAYANAAAAYAADAADAAAYAATDVAAYTYAAYAAGYAADAAYASGYAADAEREKYYIELSNELIRLIEEVKA